MLSFKRTFSAWSSFNCSSLFSLISSIPVVHTTLASCKREYASVTEKRRRLKIAIAKKLNFQDPNYWNPNTVIKRKIVTFPNRYFALDIPSVLNKTRLVVFRVPLEITKPEIKAMLTEYYDMDVKKVNTTIYQGKEKRDKKGRKIKQPDYKKAYVILNNEIEIPWPEEVRREIARHRDPRLNKIYEKEQRDLENEQRMAEQEAAEEAVRQQQAGTPLLETSQ